MDLCLRYGEVTLGIELKVWRTRKVVSAATLQEYSLSKGKEFGQRFRGETGSGRIVAITSDHTAGNLPYGASKGAMDRIVLASAQEFRSLGITANVINPGATDTGWMSEDYPVLVAS